MPELPEVEVTRLSFVEKIRHAYIQGVFLGKPLRWPLGCDIATLAGRRVCEVTRRGKYLWLALDDGGLLLHLGMSGSVQFGTDLAARGPHDHFELLTDRGVLRLHDPRRFGAVVWAADATQGMAGKLLGSLGREPFDADLDGAWLHGQLKGRRVSIKAALLAGDIIVGVGNIYASESLFLAGIDPRLPAGRLSRPRCERLVAAVRTTLAQALEAGGTTLRDFRNAQGVGGYFQLQARVYGRAGEPCVACGSPVRLIRQGQRATYFCRVCQRR